MSDGNYTAGCGQGGNCGHGPTPCFPPDSGSFNALVERGPLDYDDLSDSQFHSDSDALNCGRWDDPNAACDVDTCAVNFFCFFDYAEAEAGF